MKTITIILKTPEEVLAEVSERITAPSLQVEKKGTWVWVSGTERSDNETAATLKDIGFKWSGKRKAWYHTCETDPRKKAYGGRKQQRSTKPEVKQTHKAAARTSISDEFAKLASRLA